MSAGPQSDPIRTSCRAPPSHPNMVSSVSIIRDGRDAKLKASLSTNQRILIQAMTLCFTIGIPWTMGPYSHVCSASVHKKVKVMFMTSAGYYMTGQSCSKSDILQINRLHSLHKVCTCPDICRWQSFTTHGSSWPHET